MDIDHSTSVDINTTNHHQNPNVINDWNWWPVGAEGSMVSNDVVEGATVVASSSSMRTSNSTSAPFSRDYDDDWLAEQLANIPMLNVTDGASATSEIIQINQNAPNGNGYTLVADRELAAILGGHVDRDTIYWLLANFKLERNAVMPRGFLYSKYEAFCLFHGKPLMNQACMGKTVRALFRGLETRRLGRRGKSRYHYIGLAINPEGEFAGMVPIEPEEPTPEPGDGERKRRRTTLAAKKLQENPIGKHFEAMDPDSRADAALDQLEKMLNVRRNRYVIPQSLRTEPSWHDNLPFADDGLLPLGLDAADMSLIFRTLKCHMGLLGHSILTGVLYSIPSILNNLWISQTPSLQIPENFDQDKFALSLTWPAFVDFIGTCYSETYATVLDHLLGKTDKAQNSSFLDFLYEFATKYGQWIEAVSLNLTDSVQVILNASASSFCQMMKQLAILNSALALVDLVERDRSKAAVATEGFRSLSDRFVLAPFSTCQSEHLTLSVQTISMMEFIFQHDYMLQRWRGWVKRVMEYYMENVELDCAGLDLTNEEVVHRKELALAELRLVWLGLLYA
ncbi:hypothetical protein RvY_04055 [Ramazzottius varieornatus]|uniref:RFX-type winged-helix domain-containing protein n=1 Tax=Ramazzottius varieornatus TaxID=947166 RepID=A0A1D1UTP2_RAMVA|nr:hypothetical protein RvY_04055 [Ramazzottius varieornatus]